MVPGIVLAYIDAGSGSLVIQALIAALAAVPFFFRRQFARVIDVVRRAAGREAHTDK